MPDQMQQMRTGHRRKRGRRHQFPETTSTGGGGATQFLFQPETIIQGSATRRERVQGSHDVRLPTRHDQVAPACG